MRCAEPHTTIRSEGLALLLSLAAVLASTQASAEPGLWQRALDPKLAAGQRLLVEAERARVPESALLADVVLDRLLARRTVILIELAGGADNPDLALSFLYGDAQIHANLGQVGEGRELLEDALQTAPDSPQAARAWATVAFAAALQGDTASERTAYDRALSKQWDRDVRAILLLNRGEARMRLGDLPGAIADYRRSLHSSADAHSVALAHWGLSVAYDRDDNFPLAREEMHKALAINMGSPSEPRWAIDSPEVWFSPEYEEHYYRALALMVRAGQRSEAAEAKQDLEAALTHWNEFMTQGALVQDRWLRQASRNRERCRRQLTQPGHEH